MEALIILKEKIESLVSLTQQLKKENANLCQKQEKLQVQNNELKTENAKFAEDNAQLEAQIKSLEDVSIKESGQLKELSQDRSSAKAAVEDLIKSIDVLVEHEVQ